MVPKRDSSALIVLAIRNHRLRCGDGGHRGRDARCHRLEGNDLPSGLDRRPRAAGLSRQPGGSDRSDPTFATGDRLADLTSIAKAYRLFAEREARGRSPLYERLASGVADDRGLLGFLARLPQPKRQPNLLFAAVRYLYGTPDGWDGFRGLVERDTGRLEEVMLTRSTQTNEPARCATLLPALGLLPQPLALLEVGAAAGLCLLPDYYVYDYDGRALAAREDAGVAPPRFSCRASPETPVPAENVRVAWRAGLDLAPVDVADPDQVAWLEALVWPGQGARRTLLRSAIEVARRARPVVHRGHMVDDLPALVAAAPAGATLVVFHTALLPYVSAEERAAFSGLARAQPVWIANEGPRLLARAAARLHAPQPRSGEFLLAMNDRPLAWTDPHGAAIRWIDR